MSELETSICQGWDDAVSGGGSGIARNLLKQNFRNELIKSGDAVEVTTPNGHTP